jgi:hypothetical protein
MCTVLLVSRVVINGGVGGCALDRALGRSDGSGDVYIVIVSMGDGWERKGMGGSDKCCRSIE